ncbi:MAG: Mbeg1-like protein [Oscillospiraceae bacterium]
MPNISDYIDWRGDLPLSVSPFNEVDNLVISKLVALNFTGIIPEDGEISLREAAQKYFDKYGDEDVPIGVLSAPGVVTLIKKLLGSVRFGDIMLSYYINSIDCELEKQFSAVTVALSDGSCFIAFRGTDDTLVAWKEDFKMGIANIVPAQGEATFYLCRAAWRLACPLRVGGHSKGGNLAVYASMHAPEEVQDRILNIYNNDGPGFFESVRSCADYMRIQPRVTTLVPQHSLVGILLSHDDDFEIVLSTDTGLAAHNAFSWEVCGTAFVRCEDFSLRSRVFDRAVHSWADDLDLETRAQFIDAFFDALASTGATTLSDLTELRLRKAVELVQNLRQSADQRELFSGVLDLFIREYVFSARSSSPKKAPKATKKIPKSRPKKDKKAP